MIEVTPVTIIVLLIIWGGLSVSLALDALNLLNQKKPLPEVFRDVIDTEKLNSAKAYLIIQTRFSWLKGVTSTVVVSIFLLLGGFAFVESWVSSRFEAELSRGLAYFGVLSGLLFIISLPFSAYHTFRIESDFGFNQSTVGLWIKDQIKGLVLAVILGGIALSGILWFLEFTGQWGWLYAWIGFSLFQLALLYLAPVFILPLFNKYTPLPDGHLKSSIEQLARDQGFQCAGIFTMDGSKRSSKTNAFFTGFGKFRRIVLFDTLVNQHSTEEIVAVLAHEIGHWKRKHIWKQTVLSLASSLAMFYLFSLFLKNPIIFKGFGVERLSTYGSLVFFALLYSPLSGAIGILSLVLSRKYEFEADSFSLSVYPVKTALIQALKKLAAHNLSNLTPHPLVVFFEYSHPPVIDRIRAIEGRSAK